MTRASKNGHGEEAKPESDSGGGMNRTWWLLIAIERLISSMTA